MKYSLKVWGEAPTQKKVAENIKILLQGGCKAACS